MLRCPAEFFSYVRLGAASRVRPGRPVGSSNAPERFACFVTDPPPVVQIHLTMTRRPSRRCQPQSRRGPNLAPAGCLAATGPSCSPPSHPRLVTFPMPLMPCPMIVISVASLLPLSKTRSPPPALHLLGWPTRLSAETAVESGRHDDSSRTPQKLLPLARNYSSSPHLCAQPALVSYHSVESPTLHEPPLSSAVHMLPNYALISNLHGQTAFLMPV